MPGIQSRLVPVFKDLFSFLFQRGSAEEHVARYVLREHERGRSLQEILDDKYVVNRLDPEQRRRLLDRPEVISAFTHDVVASAKASI
jgi:hypothetical protein